jgi:predicted N-acetyltransferase YhbS
VAAVQALIQRTFMPKAGPPLKLASFCQMHQLTDPAFAPEQYIFRRDRRGVVSALKVFVRELHHPAGPFKVTLIGNVCTREDQRRKGLIGPVLRASLDYSKRIGAKGQFIVTPREGYYERHGYRCFKTLRFTGPLPDAPPDTVRIELLQRRDATWMTEMYNRRGGPYGPIVRSLEYMRKWVLTGHVGRLGRIGLKLVRRGKPVAYLIAEIGRPACICETVALSDRGRDEALLAGHLRRLGRRRFEMESVAESHPFILSLRRRGARLRRETREHAMAYPLSPDLPPPGEAFTFSPLDKV